VAIHILSALAYIDEESTNSELLAQSINTNPVVVRRLLKSLERQGLVEIRAGKGGGARLARPAREITLDQVYHAVEREEGIFALPHREANQQCPVGCRMKLLLEPIFTSALASVETVLSKSTLADLVEGIRG